MAKSITKNSIFYIIYTSLNLIFPFITGVYVSHVLIESLIGEVEAARNIAQYFLILAYLGIPTYGIREIAKARGNKEELSKVFSELVIINIISSTIFSILYLVVILSVPVYRDNLPLYLITGGTVVLNLLNITYLYEGLEEFGFICWRNLIFKIACFVLLVIFVRGNGDYLIYAAITIIGIAGNYLLNVFRARRYVKFTIKNLSFKRHLRPVFYLVVVNLAIEIYTLVDITMLKFLTTNESVAYYSYGSKIYKIFIHLLNSFTMVIVPRLTSYFKNNDKKAFNHLLSKTLTVVLLFAIPAMIGTFFTADYLITAIYGSNYITSAKVLKILSIIFIISPVGYLLGSRVLLVTGKERFMIYPVLIGSIVNIVANYFLIKNFQEMGAAYGSLISELVVACIYILLSRKNIILNDFWKNFIKIIFASIVTTLALVFVKNMGAPLTLSTTIKEIIVAVAIYFGCLLCLREATVKHYINVFKRRLC